MLKVPPLSFTRVIDALCDDTPVALYSRLLLSPRGNDVGGGGSGVEVGGSAVEIGGSCVRVGCSGADVVDSRVTITSGGGVSSTVSDASPQATKHTTRMIHNDAAIFPISPSND